MDISVQALARRRLKTLNEKVKRGGYVPAIEYMIAFAWLEKALEERNRSAFEVKVNPLFDGLRADARFEGLLRRAGLSQ